MALAALSNRTIVLASAGVVAAAILAVVLPSGPDPVQQLGSDGIQVEEGAIPTEAPRVVTVAEYVTKLGAAERACLEAGIGVAEAAALASGEGSITDVQLQALNSCVNPTLPNAAGVVQ